MIANDGRFACESAEGEPSQKIILKNAALSLGLKCYFTGKPCPKGHVAERRVSNDCCVVCQRAALKAWKAANPEKVKQSAKAWREANPERQRQAVLAWHKANSERKRQLEKKWRASNPASLRAKRQAYRARKRGAEGRHTKADILKLHERQKCRCANCCKSLKKEYHIDHIVPLARGGTNWPSNLQLLCPGCNIRKRDRCPIEWANENGRLL